MFGKGCDGLWWGYDGSFVRCSGLQRATMPGAASAMAVSRPIAAAGYNGLRGAKCCDGYCGGMGYDGCYGLGMGCFPVALKQSYISVLVKVC